MTLQEAMKRLQCQAAGMYKAMEDTDEAREYIGREISVLNVATDCIAKQIGMPPLNKGNYRCPICNRIFGAKLNYCSNCGQAIDWGEPR